MVDDVPCPRPEQKIQTRADEPSTSRDQNLCLLLSSPSDTRRLAYVLTYCSASFSCIYCVARPYTIPALAITTTTTTITIHYFCLACIWVSVGVQFSSPLRLKINSMKKIVCKRFFSDSDLDSESESDFDFLRRSGGRPKSDSIFKSSPLTFQGVGKATVKGEGG